MNYGNIALMATTNLYKICVRSQNEQACALNTELSHLVQHALNLLLIVRCFKRRLASDQAPGSWGATACRIPTFVNMFAALSQKFDQNEQKLFHKTAYTTTTGRFGQTNIA